MNKKGLIISSVLVVILVIAGTTLSLLTTKSETKTNEFVPGVLTAPIWENGKLAPDNTSSLIPTDKTVKKEVQAENISGPHEVDAYIRVMLVPTFRNEYGTLAGDVQLDPNGGNSITVKAPDGGTVTLNLIDGWGNYWIYDNGYFYFKPVVHPGKMTKILLEDVTVSDPELWNTFNLEVLSDSIQAENNAVAEWKMVPEVEEQLEQYK